MLRLLSMLVNPLAQGSKHRYSDCIVWVYPPISIRGVTERDCEMSYVFEKQTAVRQAALAYWDAYHMWERCKAEPDTTMQDWRDCADDCRRRRDAWARAIYKAGGGARNGAWPLARCRAWVDNRILEIIDADNAARRRETENA